MNASDYRLLAAIVRELPDSLRKSVADHFAVQLNRRCVGFNSLVWRNATGGELVPEKQETEDEKRARVMAHVAKVTGRPAR